MTERQLEVLTALSFGLTYAEAARELGIGLETVKYHADNLRKKFEVRTSTEAVALGFRQGILSRDFGDE